MSKKSFILHLDSLSILDELNFEQKGILFDTIYKYHLGVNVELDFAMKMAFLPFKNQFIRDNESYQKIVERNKNNGLKGGRKSKQPNLNQKNPVGYLETQSNPLGAKKADSDNDNDSDSVKDINKINNLFGDVFSFKNQLLKDGVPPDLVSDFMKVRKKKKATDTSTAYKKFISEVKKTDWELQDIVRLCVERDWKGFEAVYLDNIPKSNNTKVSNTLKFATLEEFNKPIT